MMPLIHADVNSCATYLPGFLIKAAEYQPPPRKSVTKYEVYELIKKAKEIKLKPSVMGTFSVMAKAILYYGKNVCYMKQTNIGLENPHKPLKVRQVKTHQANLVNLGLLKRRDRVNRRLPYEHELPDIGLIHYLLFDKFMTDPWEIAQRFCAIKKLHLERDENCTSHRRSYIKDKDTGFTTLKKEIKMSKSSLADAFQQERDRDEALKMAREELKTLGIEYPEKTEEISPIEHYDLIRAYADREAVLIAKYLKKGPVNTLKPKVVPIKQPERWGNKGWSYD